MILAIGWPHDPGDQAHATLRGGPVTLAIGWPHDGDDSVRTWPHDAFGAHRIDADKAPLRLKFSSATASAFTTASMST